jgi:hypothetical protein
MAERLELLRVNRQAVAAQAALAAESNAQVLILRAGQGLPQSSLRLSGPGLRWGLGGLRMIRGHWLGQSLRLIAGLPIWQRNHCRTVPHPIDRFERRAARRGGRIRCAFSFAS